MAQIFNILLSIFCAYYFGH